MGDYGARQIEHDARLVACPFLLESVPYLNAR